MAASLEWLKINFMLIIYSHNSTNPENLAKIGPADLALLVWSKSSKNKQNKPPRGFALCWLDFDTPLSSIATLPQSPLPSRPHSWLPSTNHPYSTLAFLHFLSSRFSSSLFPPSPPPHFSPLSSLLLYIYAYNMPIVLHYIQLYGICYPRRRLWRNVRPTSQRRAVSPAARFFARRHIFLSTVSFSNLYRPRSRFAWSKRGSHYDVTAAMW